MNKTVIGHTTPSEDKGETNLELGKVNDENLQEKNLKRKKNIKKNKRNKRNKKNYKIRKK